jgi:hypothetical protein
VSPAPTRSIALAAGGDGPRRTHGGAIIDPYSAPGSGPGGQEKRRHGGSLPRHSRSKSVLVAQRSTQAGGCREHSFCSAARVFAAAEDPA